MRLVLDRRDGALGDPVDGVGGDGGVGEGGEVERAGALHVGVADDVVLELLGGHGGELVVAELVGEALGVVRDDARLGGDELGHGGELIALEGELLLPGGPLVGDGEGGVVEVEGDGAGGGEEKAGGLHD